MSDQYLVKTLREAGQEAGAQRIEELLEDVRRLNQRILQSNTQNEYLNQKLEGFHEGDRWTSAGREYTFRNGRWIGQR